MFEVVIGNHDTWRGATVAVLFSLKEADAMVAFLRAEGVTAPLGVLFTSIVQPEKTIVPSYVSYAIH